MWVRVGIPLLIMVVLMALRATTFGRPMGPWDAEWIAWVFAMVAASTGFGYGLAKLNTPPGMIDHRRPTRRV